MNVIFTLIISLLVTLIIISFAMFVYYKAQQIRTNRDVQTAHFKSIARIWLGMFLIAFGLNTIVQFHTVISYIIGALFIIIGSYQVYYFNRARKYFKGNLPIEEKAWANFEAKKRGK